MTENWPSVKIKNKGLEVEQVISRHDEPFETKRNPESATELPASADLILTESINDDHPAEFEIKFTNTSDESLEVGFGPTPPFDNYGGQYNENHILYLLPLKTEGSTLNIEHLIPTAPSSGVWKTKDHFVIPDQSTRLSIEPNESVSRKYVLLAPASEQDPDRENILSNKESKYKEIECDFEMSYRIDDRMEKGSRLLCWQFSIVIG